MYASDDVCRPPAAAVIAVTVSLVLQGRTASQLSDPAGTASLLSAVAELVSTNGYTVTPDQIRLSNIADYTYQGTGTGARALMAVDAAGALPRRAAYDPFDTLGAHRQQARFLQSLHEARVLSTVASTDGTVVLDLPDAYTPPGPPADNVPILPFDLAQPSLGAGAALVVLSINVPTNQAAAQVTAAVASALSTDNSAINKATASFQAAGLQITVQASETPYVLGGTSPSNTPSPSVSALPMASSIAASAASASSSNPRFSPGAIAGVVIAAVVVLALAVVAVVVFERRRRLNGKAGASAAAEKTAAAGADPVAEAPAVSLDTVAVVA